MNLLHNDRARPPLGPASNQSFQLFSAVRRGARRRAKASFESRASASSTHGKMPILAAFSGWSRDRVPEQRTTPLRIFDPPLGRWFEHLQNNVLYGGWRAAEHSS